jgi:hypothetical protein
MKHFFAERNASQRTPKGEQISPLENPLSLNVKSARAVLRAFKAPQRRFGATVFRGARGKCAFGSFYERSSAFAKTCGIRKSYEILFS